MMNTYHTINTAGLLVLTIGWFLIGTLLTSIIAHRFVMRADERGYGQGWQNAADYYTRNAR
jgi:glycerol-3-phosphate acyltransferase PlsY